MQTVDLGDFDKIRLGDSNDLAKKIELLINADNTRLAEMSENCKSLAYKVITTDVVTNKLEKIFNEENS